MDIEITVENDFYTVNLQTELAVNWTKLHHTVETFMAINESLFYIDSLLEFQEYVTKAIKNNLTVSLNGGKLELNPDDAITYALERKV